MTFPPAVIAAARAFRFALPLLGAAAVQRTLRRLVEERVEPPTAEDRERGRTHIWGRVEDISGRSVEGTLRCGEGYAFTVHAALAIAEKVRSGAVPAGATTPARALGGDFVRTLPDVTISLPGD
jgi:short subunit dehydrogenase-like uncharacterized protein